MSENRQIVKSCPGTDMDNKKTPVIIVSVTENQYLQMIYNCLQAAVIQL